MFVQQGGKNTIFSSPSLPKTALWKQAGHTVWMLLKVAKQAVPRLQWKRTPVVLRATAGLRLLPAEKAQALLDQVLPCDWDKVKPHTFCSPSFSSTSSFILFLLPLVLILPLSTPLASPPTPLLSAPFLSFLFLLLPSLLFLFLFSIQFIF